MITLKRHGRESGHSTEQVTVQQAKEEYQKAIDEGMMVGFNGTLVRDPEQINDQNGSMRIMEGRMQGG